MIIIDKIEEAILDPELNDIEYKLMHEAVNKGKNVRIRVLTTNFWQLKRETNVNLQHLDLKYFLVRVYCKTIKIIPKTRNEIMRRVTNIGEL